MRIKACIANFGDSQITHLEKVVKEFESYEKHEVDIKIFTTVDIPHLPNQQVILPEFVTTSLPYMCRPEMVKELENYDLFIFNENDHLITEDNIDAFIQVSKKLDANQLCGFIRYEEIYGIRVLIDQNPYYGDLVDKKYKNYFSCANKHQGCWVLLKDDFRKIIESNNFLTDPHEGPYGILEQGASDPYTQCDMEKIFPLDLPLLRRLMIKHLPVKYSIKMDFINNGIFIEHLYKDAVMKDLTLG